jgi:hypothetical protein
VTVTLTSEAFGKLPGETYTGAEEDWLLAQGYASRAGYATDTAAVLTGTTNAVNVVTGGNLVVSVDDETYTVAIATADTPAQAATKIDTALTGDADAAVVSSKLKITSAATGSNTNLRVVSGTGTVLANLGLSAGQSAAGGNGGPGVSDTGPTDVLPSQDPTLAENREDAPGYAGGDVEGYDGDAPYDNGGVDPYLEDPSDYPGYEPVSGTIDPPYDFDPAGSDDEAPSFAPATPDVTPATGAAAGGTAVVLRGEGFERATGVTFGGTAGVSFSVVDDTEIHVTTPAHAAGAVDVVILDPVSNTTKSNGFTYTA